MQILFWQLYSNHDSVTYTPDKFVFNFLLISDLGDHDRQSRDNPGRLVDLPEDKPIMQNKLT